MPDFENICKEKHIDSHRSFNNRIVELSNQCVGFSEEDYQKLRELKAEDISLLEIKAFVDSQKSVCAHQKKEKEWRVLAGTKVVALHTEDSSFLHEVESWTVL